MNFHTPLPSPRGKLNATYICGFNTWLKCGRYVRRGEKGIVILAPMFFKDKNAVGEETSVSCLRSFTSSISARPIGTTLPELPCKSTGENGADMLTRPLAFAESRD